MNSCFLPSVASSSHGADYCHVIWVHCWHCDAHGLGQGMLVSSLYLWLPPHSCGPTVWDTHFHVPLSQLQLCPGQQQGGICILHPCHPSPQPTHLQPPQQRIQGGAQKDQETVLLSVACAWVRGHIRLVRNDPEEMRMPLLPLLLWVKMGVPLSVCLKLFEGLKRGRN